jgi:aconitase B
VALGPLQARVGDKTTVVSTSTRNFPNRLGKGANVYLASAELAAVAAMMGKLPSPAEYLKYAEQVSVIPNPPLSCRRRRNLHFSAALLVRV